MPTAAALGSRAVIRVLDSGKTTWIDVKSGRMKELHAACPTDGAASPVMPPVRAKATLYGRDRQP